MITNVTTDTATEHAWKLVGLLEKAGAKLPPNTASLLRDATEARDKELGFDTYDLIRPRPEVSYKFLRSIADKKALELLGEVYECGIDGGEATGSAIDKLNNHIVSRGLGI